VGDTAMSSKNGDASTNMTFLKIIALSVALKVLLFPFYHSTDFEVHRNWLAITHSLPMHQWYHEKTSEWTLDYPPFFAYFEYMLSFFAKFFDAEMLNVENLNHASMMTVCFQRSSVLVTESILYLATIRYLESSNKLLPPGRRGKEEDAMVVFLLAVFNAGLIIVDNIHFQVLHSAMLHCVTLDCVSLYGRDLSLSCFDSLI
jgi:alpha-1,3-glucosyltransferase